jgi:hypothetical protein
MSFIFPTHWPTQGLGVYLERQRLWKELCAEGLDLVKRADAIGMREELAQVMFPPVKRGRGRQRGSHSSVASTRRAVLWLAYQKEMATSPTAKDKDIAAHLHATDPKKYGNSPTAIAAQIAALKRDDLPLLRRIGRKRGRQPKGSP